MSNEFNCDPKCCLVCPLVGDTSVTKVVEEGYIHRVREFGTRGVVKLLLDYDRYPKQLPIVEDGIQLTNNDSPACRTLQKLYTFATCARGRHTKHDTDSFTCIHLGPKIEIWGTALRPRPRKKSS